MSAATQSHFSVRKAAPSDASGILDYLKAAFEPYRARYTPEGFRDTVLTPETVRNRLAQMTVFVATNETGTVVGKVGGQGEGHLRGMAVRPEWQGCGVAEHLLRAAEAHLCGLQCSRAEGDYVRFHSGSETHLIRETMMAAEERLPSENFVRIHRSAIVNLDFVKEMQSLWGGDYSVLLRDGTKLTLSRNYRARIQENLQQELWPPLPRPESHRLRDRR